ncbi:MAG: DEAD/DEAH box helicase [Myxococcota bacterium]
MDPDRVRQALREIGFHPVPDRAEWLDAVVRGSAAATPVPGELVPTWAVGVERVRHAKGDAPVTADTVVCSCAGRRCVHVASVLVSLAFADPLRGAALRAPAWEVALAPLAPGLRLVGRPRPGRIRYDLAPPAAGVKGLRIAATIVRPGVAPLRVPRSLEALRAELGEPLPCDLQLHGALLALDRARSLDRTGKALVVRELSRALLGPLSRASEVRYDGVAVTVRRDPLPPRLVADPTPDGGLALRWEPALAAYWEDAGVVLTRAGELAALPDDLPDPVAERLTDRIPPVPPADVERFVDRLVVARGLDVALPPGLVRVREPDEREARLTLSELDGLTLEVRLERVYKKGDAEVVAAPTDPRAEVVVPDAGAVRRDLEWEREQADRFAADLGAPESVRLVGDDAYDFLLDRLPELAQRWTVWGRDRLTRLGGAGAVTPSVRFADRTDWFELDVTFTVGGRSVAPAPVIESWRRGARYVALTDGTIARLPRSWLARHADKVDLLLEAERAQRKLGAWHAWMASEWLPADSRWRAPVDAGLPEERPLPEGLRASLRPYQRRGLDWLRFLRDHGLHGLLADEMGLGKTVQALAALVDTPGPSLVVAPTSVVHNWVAEAARFTPGLRVAQWWGAGRDPAALDAADVVVTSYALLRRDRGPLLSRRWSWVVLDEAHQVKNPASRGARAVRRLDARHRLALTGTPLENDLTELWSLFTFLAPGLLGRRTAFHARYGRRPSGAALDELRERIAPLTLRRTKAEVAPELPPRTEVTLRVPLSDAERRLYDAVRNTVREQLTSDAPDRARRFLDGLTRLRQACCHPQLLPFPEARRVRGSSKLVALLERLEQVLASGERALVFSQWVALLDRVSEALDERAIAHLRLQGDTVDRGAVVRGFQAADGPPVLLVSLKAGGTGLNLTAATVVFHLDPWWNPAAEDQATDRAHRIGQHHPVTVIRLVAADTVEDHVLALQQRKRALFADTVGRAPSEPVPLDELRRWVLTDP